MILVKLAGALRSWALCSTNTSCEAASMSKYDVALMSGAGGIIDAGAAHAKLAKAPAASTDKTLANKSVSEYPIDRVRRFIMLIPSTEWVDFSIAGVAVLCPAYHSACRLGINRGSL